MATSKLQVNVVIPTQTRYLELIGSIGEHIGRELENYSGDRETLAYHLNLVLTEATTNAIKHSKTDDPRETVKINIFFDADELCIKVCDHGQGFDLENVPAPNFDSPREGGMGIYFIKTLMDSVTYTRSYDCNILEIRKSLK